MKPAESVVPLLSYDPMELEIGFGLIPLVDVSQGGDLLERITMIRRHAARELGIVVPPIRVRDNLQLKPSTYVVKIYGLEVDARRGDGLAAARDEPRHRDQRDRRHPHDRARVRPAGAVDRGERARRRRDGGLHRHRPDVGDRDAPDRDHQDARAGSARPPRDLARCSTT